MRFRHPQTILCFGFFIQVTVFAHQKNDYLKNDKRTNPKKYFPTNVSNSPSKNIDGTTVKLRHPSKFPHFDKLRSRIAGLDSKDSVDTRTNGDSHNKHRYNSDSRFYSGDSKWISSDPYPRLRHTHHGWSNRRTTSTTTTTTTTANPDDDLFETYGDMEDEYDDDKTEDEDSNYEDFFDSLEDDEIETQDDNFQAEEPTERPAPEPRKYSSLTEYKWVQLGTWDKVQEARRNYLNIKKSPEENNASAALEHYVRVKNQYQCKTPIPKVIPVHLEHPDPTVTYIPQCTVLHRCAEDTGCCKWDTTCQYKERENVSLYFYVKNIGADYTSVKTLTFYNHTECECKEKKAGNTDSNAVTERTKRIAENSRDDRNQRFSSEISLKTATNGPENLAMKCKCPKEFTPKVRYNSKCYCDCKDDNQDCIRMKKGKEYSALMDRICIINKQCGTVSCEYGPYLKDKGRCPRINEV